MLILSRRCGESIIVNDEVTLTVLSIKGKQVRIGINAPDNVSVHREEIYQRIQDGEPMKPSSKDSSVGRASGKRTTSGNTSGTISEPRGAGRDSSGSSASSRRKLSLSRSAQTEGVTDSYQDSHSNRPPAGVPQEGIKLVIDNDSSADNHE